VAQKIQTLFIDDLDGGEAEGTVRFGLDGAEFEIDLSAAHAAAFRETMERYIEAGRKTGGQEKRSVRRGGRRSASDGPNPSEVREWAKAKGLAVNDRGRVPGELIVKFQAATES
jgi:hypothetical protein